jgi:NADPH:quinone reductase-like Zn-dependent oxidoreductase
MSIRQLTPARIAISRSVPRPEPDRTALMSAYVTRGDGIDALRRVERKVPVPGPNQVLVRMRAASLNYRDLLVIRGVDSWRPTDPRVPLSDGVGVIVRLGSEARRFERGERVAGLCLPRWLGGELSAEKNTGALGGSTTDGVLAEYRVFDEEALVAVPAHLDDAEAATLPVAALTAWHAVRHRSRVLAGDWVLLQGTGGVSLFALQFVRALGAKAIVLSRSDEKLERVRELGASVTLNTTKVPDWDERVRALTDGRGVDHVVEVVGGENLNRSLRAVRVSGSISFIGLLAGVAAPINTYEFVKRNVRLHGIETGSRAIFEDMNRWIEAHALRPVVDSVFPFAEVPSALRYLESGQQFGKVVVSL